MSAPSATSATKVRFAVFEFDLRTRELLKYGHRIRLQNQPGRLLALLLCRPGELVTQDEIRRELWPDDIFVDYEHGLHRSINKIREALADSAAQPRFIETRARAGYRFSAPVEFIVEPLIQTAATNGRTDIGTKPGAIPTDEEVVASSPVVITELHRTQPRSLLTKRAAVMAAVVGVAALGLALRGVHISAPLTARELTHRGLDLPLSTAAVSIAVLPFTNVSGDVNSDYLSDGITESLIASLTHVPELKVKSRNSVFRYKGKDVDVQKVGNELGVSALVSGRLTAHGDNVEVSAELTEVRDNTEIWGQHYSGKSTDIISLQQQIVGDLVGKLRSKLSTSEKQQVTKLGTQNPEAYELYLKGRYSWNKRTSPALETAISYFNQAIDKDPGYALAYSGLADAYGVLAQYGGTPSENFLKSNAAARKALELDATLAHPHAVLGTSETAYDWDSAGGEAEYKKALELDPNDAMARAWYASDIGMIGGREQEALAEVNRAHQLDPLSPIISTAVGNVHILARQYDEAIAVDKKLANENPTFARAHFCLAQAYWGKRMYPQVIEEWKAYGLLSGNRGDSDFASALEQGFRSAGWKGALTKGIETRQAQRKTGYQSAFMIAELYADLGDKDQAFRWLNTAYQERDWLLVHLRANFRLDPLRSDPRFAELVRKVGLPQ
jgi:TolB-like protein/DNA-binding winged helix-turn-helix (wHTH) protein/tetratricopeptide (TPR) repeat protein